MQSSDASSTPAGIQSRPKAGEVLILPFSKEVFVHRYLIGQFWSLIGSNLQISCLSLMIVMRLGKVQGLVLCGDVAACAYLPGIFLALIVGAWLDVVDKRKVLLWCSWLGALQATTLAIMALDGARHITVLEIWIMAFASGLITSVDAVNRNAIMAPMLYDQKNYATTGLIFTSLYNFAMVFGGGCAAYAVRYLGYSGSYLLDALSFVALVIQLRKISLPRQKLAPGLESGLNLDKIAWPKIREGILFCWHEQGLRLSIILTGLICTFSFSYRSILRVIAEEMFGGGDILYSQFMTSVGIGALLGAFLAIYFGKMYPKQLVVIGGIICGTSLILFSRSTTPLTGTVLMFCTGFGFMSSLSTTRAAVGHIAGHKYAGRAQGLAITFFFCGVAGGSWALAHFAKHFGCPFGLLICGIITILISLIMPFMPGANEIHRFEK